MIDFNERIDSRKLYDGPDPRAELHFVLSGTASESVALALVRALAPPVFSGLFAQAAEVTPTAVDTVSGTGLWDAVVHYGRLPWAQDQMPVTTFDTTGATQHITQSLQTMAAHAPPGKTPPDFKGAIGVTDADVEGTDVPVPVMTWSETHLLPAAIMTTPYRYTLFNLTGCVNDAPFKGCAAGECLFAGASGRQKGVDAWEITYTFRVSPNRTNLLIGDITVAYKAGWDYLWVRHEERHDANAHAIVRRPVAAYVERVFRWADFGALGVGA